MNPSELTLRITALANVIASQLTDGELEIAAAAFTQIGDTLAVIALSRARGQERQAAQ